MGETVTKPPWQHRIPCSLSLSLLESSSQRGESLNEVLWINDLPELIVAKK